MFVAEMANGCGMRTWSLNSQIVHATAASPLGPYQRREVVATPFAHNPTVVRAPDGTYVMYQIGCGAGHKPECPANNCSNGATGHAFANGTYPSGNWKCPASGGAETVDCGPVWTPDTTPTSAHILYASSLDGPWQSIDANLTDVGIPPRMGKWGIDNPAPYFFPNGSVLLLGRCEWNTVGSITAESWRGPYRMGREIGDVSVVDGVAEDPFIWRDMRGNFHALFHGGKQSFQPGATNHATGAHGFSEDGVEWTYSPIPAFGTNITTADGKIHSYARRERPHLIFNRAGEPTHLYTALTNWTLYTTKPDLAFTFAQAIPTAAKSA